MGYGRKIKKTNLLVEKSLMNCPLLDLKNLRENRMLCSHLQTLLCGQFIADFLRKEFDF